ARGPSRGSLLPWILCGLLAVTWAGVGVRWYKSAPQKSEETSPGVSEDVKAYQAALGKLTKAEEKLRQMQADLEAKKPDATPEKASAAQLARATAAKTSAEAMVAKAESALAASKARVTRAVAYQDRARSDFSQAEQQNVAGTISTQDYQKYKADKLASDADLI